MKHKQKVNEFLESMHDSIGIVISGIEGNKYSKEDLVVKMKRLDEILENVVNLISLEDEQFNFRK